ncbi:MAG: hypothetical protein IKQ41_13300 [Clostridia bacterium]|nr:hypothetical protein [Clostridia bacterium]
MGLFDAFFGKKEKRQPNDQANAANNILLQQKLNYNALVMEKDPQERVSEKTLLEIFAAYFAPNKDFYSVPGSEKFNAYFHAVNAARDEMFSQRQLFAQATKWNGERLAQLVNDPKPGVTNMMICGLIFLMGQYAVVKSALYCVDFAEEIPHCIALYLLLIAQKQPQDKRKQGIDAGEGTNKKPLEDAMNALKACDPAWSFSIW